MTQFFIGLYDYFERHKILFYLSLISCVLLMGFFALQVRFEENITQFFPDTKDSQNTIKVFDNLKIKDKIIIMLSSADTCHRVEPDSLIEAAGQLQQTLTEKAGGKLIKGILAQVDQSLIQGATDFVYEHLPLFLTDTDYQRFDSLLTDKGIQAVMQKNYTNLLSPAGIALRSYILRDPLGLGSETLKHLQDFQLEANYEIYDEHIFSKDGSTLLMFITPVFSTGSTGKNDELIKILEEELKHVQGESPTIRAEYFGGPSVGVYNARQIKKDTILTSSLALLIIIVFISLVFKRKRSIPLIITPVLFGGLFALFLIFFIKGSISAIAVGAGSAVMGNALEYPLPESDVFILNDMLHYMSYEHQQTLLLKCAGRLRSQGMIIIRDGNSANASKHRLTRFTELLSTRIFNFNRTTGELYFTTETQLREIAVACGMAVEIIPNDKYTSNTIYIFRKPN